MHIIWMFKMYISRRLRSLRVPLFRGYVARGKTSRGTTTGAERAQYPGNTLGVTLPSCLVELF